MLNYYENVVTIFERMLVYAVCCEIVLTEFYAVQFLHSQLCSLGVYT